MKIDEVRKNVKNKLLLTGKTGTGKTHLSLHVAFMFSREGKKVVYIDPEYGTQKEVDSLYSSEDIEDGDIENIDLKVTPTWLEYLDAVENADCDLLVLEMSDAMRLHRRYLENKIKDEGGYIIEKNRIPVKDKETFTLPYNFYPKIYNVAVNTMYHLVEQPYHFIVTLTPVKGTEAKEEFMNFIMMKADTVIDLEKGIQGNQVQYTGTVVKNRGGTSNVVIGNPEEPVLGMFRKVL